MKIYFGTHCAVGKASDISLDKLTKPENITLKDFMSSIHGHFKGSFDNDTHFINFNYKQHSLFLSMSNSLKVEGEHPLDEFIVEFNIMIKMKEKVEFQKLRITSEA